MHALYFLAANPSYATVLRQEVEETVVSEGWGRDSVNKMRKLDSFLRESSRLRTLGTRESDFALFSF